MKVIVLGERANAQLTFPAHTWGIDRMFESGSVAFTNSQRDKLLRLGVRGDRYVNLLPPSTLVGNWKPDYAKTTARALLKHLAADCEHVLLVCCGSRVSYAVWNAYKGIVDWPAASLIEKFCDVGKYPRTWCEFVRLRNVTTCRVPHPSGRCRVWNDQELVNTLRERYLSGLCALEMSLSPSLSG